MEAHSIVKCSMFFIELPSTVITSLVGHYKHSSLLSREIWIKRDGRHCGLGLAIAVVVNILLVDVYRKIMESETIK